jgi:hypothetical protein
MVFTPSLFDPPTDPPADPARVQRYLAVCAEYGDKPGRLVRLVTGGRTIDPAAVTGAEMDALLDAWLRDHNATLAPAQDAHRTPLRDPEPGITAPSRDLQITPNQRVVCDDLGITAPQSTPGIAPGPRPTVVRRTKGGITPSPEASGDAGPQRLR